jgi:hypothetical protein
LLPAFEPQKDASADDADHPKTNAQHPDIATVQVQEISQKPDEDEVNQKDGAGYQVDVHS